MRRERKRTRERDIEGEWGRDVGTAAHLSRSPSLSLRIYTYIYIYIYIYTFLCVEGEREREREQERERVGGDVGTVQTRRHLVILAADPYSCVASL